MEAVKLDMLLYLGDYADDGAALHEDYPQYLFPGQREKNDGCVHTGRQDERRKEAWHFSLEYICYFV